MREARRRNLYSTADARHIVMHEMGELAMHQSVGGDRFSPLERAYQQAEQDFQRVDSAMIQAVVSAYAIRSHSDFVAEVFAALTLGRGALRDDPEIMEAFERFGGDRLLQWTQR